MTNVDLKRRVLEERLRKLSWQRRRREREQFEARIDDALERRGYIVRGPHRRR